MVEYYETGRFPPDVRRETFKNWIANKIKIMSTNRDVKHDKKCKGYFCDVENEVCKEIRKRNDDGLPVTYKKV